MLIKPVPLNFPASNANSAQNIRSSDVSKVER